MTGQKLPDCPKCGQVRHTDYNGNDWHTEEACANTIRTLKLTPEQRLLEIAVCLVWGQQQVLNIQAKAKREDWLGPLGPCFQEDIGWRDIYIRKLKEQLIAMGVDVNKPNLSVITSDFPNN